MLKVQTFLKTCSSQCKISSVRNMAYVIGVGMTKFEKPKTRDWDYPDMGREAGRYPQCSRGLFELCCGFS